jgi:6-methylsalicylate decarboxylase
MRMHHENNGHRSHIGLSRRSVLAGASACIGGLVLGCEVERALAQGARPAGIIDVHHHVSPPQFVNALTKYKLGERPMLDWTPGRSIADMDRAGVALSITSITTPGVWFGDNREARDLARACNEYAAGLAQQYPGPAVLGRSPRCRCPMSMDA